MSTSAIRKSVKPITPFSGKENLDPPQRFPSRPRGGVNEARARWSTSSVVPRGRSCSPSRVWSKGGSRVSVDRVVGDKRCVFDRFSASKKCTQNGNRVSEKFDENGGNKKLGSRAVGNPGGNSGCLSHIEIKLDDGIVFCDEGRVLEGLKVRNCGEKSGNSGCSSEIEMKLNDGIDSGDRGRVLEGLKVRTWVEKSEGSGCSSELEMKLDDGSDSSDKGRVLEGLKVRTCVEKSGNSGCSSKTEMKLDDGIGFCDEGRIVEGLKVRDCVEKRVNLLSLEESRLNDADARYKNWVSHLTDLKSGNKASLKCNVELSWKSGTSAEAKMRSSVGNIAESLKSKVLIGQSHVDLTEKDDLFEDVKVRTNNEKSDKLISKESRLVGRSSSLSEKAVIGEGKDSKLSAKRYPSKLHEKLAYLEGKVKKIASDIKQTKDMLDLHNPDVSKVILSSIQEKISGIEKEMSNVVSVGSVNVRIQKNDGDDYGKGTESTKQEERRVGDGKRSVNGLSAQELEARLFPQQKFLKDRTSLNPSSDMSHVDELRESTQNQKQLDRARSSIDEPIAMEILESLKNEQSGNPIEYKNGDTDNNEGAAHMNNSASLVSCQNNVDFFLTSNEKLEEFDEQEITSRMVIDQDNEDSCEFMLKEIGHKISTGGWFVSEGEAVLLAHDDGSCSYYDITNCEAKAEYKPPVGLSPNMWRDCWIVPAPSADGCAGRYVVAASAGNSFQAGFCSWDFYTKDVRAFHVEDGIHGTANVRTALADLPNNTMHRRNPLSSTMSPEHQQWFYRPCGPLIVSTASCQRSVKVYDIRDGEHVMRWELQKPVATMEYSSPLQWRNKGKVVVAESETVSLYDVSSLNPHPLLSVSSSNRKISALHVNNTDGELGGGVRQRVSSSEVEGNDGVFCSSDSINVLDFRKPSGIGLKIPKVGVDVHSTFSRGDSILLGCTSLKSAGKKQFSSQIQQFSLRKQGLSSTYVLPDYNAHPHYKAIIQVWGNSNLVMGVCGLGLCVYDSSKDVVLPYAMDSAQMNNVKDVIGPDDLYYPSFDYLASRVLLISRDRPALWRYLS